MVSKRIMKDHGEKIKNRTESLKERTKEVDRRSFLKGAGVAGGAVGALGIVWYGTRDPDDPDDPDPPDEEPPDDEPPDIEPPDDEPPDDEPPDDEQPYEEEFDTVVDAVEEGADPSGEETINFLFEQHTEDDTLFLFDAGVYRYDPVSFSGRSNIGFVGAEEDDCQFVPTDGGCRGGHPYVLFDGVSDLRLERITFDFQDIDSGGPIHMFLGGVSLIRDVSYFGSCSNQLGVFRIEIHDENGSAQIENLRSENNGENHTLTGVYVGGGHAGELTFRDCHLGEFSDNGLYASAPGGPDGQDGEIHVVGGTYRNNNIAGVRLGSSGSTAQDVTVVVDDETPGWGQLNARGIRLRNKADQLIENCEIVFEEEAADSFGAVVFHPANGGGLVRDTSIQINRENIPAFKAFPIEQESNSAPVFENVSVNGTASSGFTGEIEGRNGTQFRNCTIDQTAGERRGLQLIDCQNCQIVDSEIAVAEFPISLRNASLTLQNTRVATERGEEFFEELTLEDEDFTLD